MSLNSLYKKISLSLLYIVVIVSAIIILNLLFIIIIALKIIILDFIKILKKLNFVYSTKII